MIFTLIGHTLYRCTSLRHLHLQQALVRRWLISTDWNRKSLPKSVAVWIHHTAAHLGHFARRFWTWLSYTLPVADPIHPDWSISCIIYNYFVSVETFRNNWPWGNSDWDLISLRHNSAAYGRQKSQAFCGGEWIRLTLVPADVMKINCNMAFLCIMLFNGTPIEPPNFTMLW